MKDLITLSPVHPISMLKELSQLSEEVKETNDKTKIYIQKLESFILHLLIRTPEKIDSDINKIVNSLASITDKYILAMKIDADYGSDFFKHEIDNSFKVALARALLDLLQSRFGNSYSNPLLHGIANQELEYLDFFHIPFVD